MADLMNRPISRLIAWLAAVLIGLVAPTAAHAQCARWLTSADDVPPGLRGTAECLAVMPNGDVIAGGSFSRAGSVAAARIARWNGSSWAPIGSGMNGSVYALKVLPNGDLVAGGTFTTAGGLAANNIARWNGSSWAPIGSGMNASVGALEVLPNGDLVAGGTFTTADGSAANRIARWNGSSWSAVGSGLGGVTTPSVNELAVLPNGDLVAGGNFATAGGVAANSIARWNGSSWAPLGSGVNGRAVALKVLPNGDLVAGGTFTTAGGVAANRIARWNGSSWAALGSGMNIDVNSLAVLPGGDLVAGGSFAFAGGVTVNFVARWNGSSWAPLGSGFGAVSGDSVFVSAFAVLPNGDLVAGGKFTTVGGVAANNIARWNGSSWSALGAGLQESGSPLAEVSDLVVLPNGDLVAVGRFNSAGGVAANGIARWNGSSWAPVGPGLSSIVPMWAIAVMPNGDIVTAWSPTFSSSSIRRWNDGSSWSSLGTFLGSGAYDLVVLPNGDLVAAGQFSLIGNVYANNIARWNGTAWSALGSGIPGQVFSLAVLPNGDLVAGGNFQGSAPYIARWNGSSWAPLGAGLNYYVSNLAVMPNGNLVATGAFTASGGVQVNRIARWDGLSWAAIGSGLNSTGDAVALLPSGVLVAAVGTSSDSPSSAWARWTDTGIPWVAQQPAAQSIDAGATLTLTASCASGYDFNGAVGFQWKRDGVDIADGANGASKGGGTVAGASGALTTTTLATTLTITGARPSDSGDYTVVFTNSCGAVTSVAATVTIEGACPADLDGDGLVNGTDLAQLLSSWGGTGGDVNGDGTTSGEDLAAILSAWGACG